MATLADLRADVKAESGRADLSPAKLDILINEGIRMLDRMSNFSHAPSIQHVFLNQGESNLTFSADCRTLRGVYCIQAGVGKTRLDRLSFDEVMEWNAENTDEGVPLFYSPRVIRAYPDGVDLSGADYDDYRSFITTLDSTPEYRGITVAPVASEKFLMELLGVFYSPRLTTYENAPMLTNWWATNQYSAVVNSAMFMLMKTYRNSEGMNTYMAPISETLRSIDYDEAEEEASEVTRLEG